MVGAVGRGAPKAKSGFSGTIYSNKGNALNHFHSFCIVRAARACPEAGQEKQPLRFAQGRRAQNDHIKWFFTKFLKNSHFAIAELLILD